MGAVVLGSNSGDEFGESVRNGAFGYSAGSVALAEGRRTYRRIGPYSDRKGKFGKDGRKPIPWVDIDAEFVVAAAKILDEGMPGADHSRRT